MKAARNTIYGPPSVIAIADVPKPKPGPKDVMVRIHYSSVNRTDVGFLHAKPFVTRFFTGLTKPKYLTLGCEFSGIVEAVGRDVSLFKAGDKVFGFDDKYFGSYAEYKVIGEQAMIEVVPAGISLEQAAVSLEGAHYALFYLYKIPHPNNTTVFVHGATGAIGSAAVQLLKAAGYYVEASSTTKDTQRVKNLGADKVIDWQTQNISSVASKCDVFFDAVGKSTFKEARKILKPGGIYMSSELGPYCQNPIFSLINPMQRMLTKRNIIFPVPKTRKIEAQVIKKHLEDNTFRPLVDRKYCINEIVEAFEYVESGNKVGNVVVKIT